MVDSKKTTGMITGVVGLLFLVGFTVLFLPVIQSIAYTLLVQAPFLWYFALMGGGVAIAAASYGHPTVAMVVGVFTLVMILFIGPYMASVYAQEHILENQEFEQQAELPETSTEHVRVLPRNVANQYAQSANQLPKYKTGSSDIAYHEGNYTWAYGVIPDRFFVAWQGNQWGAYYVDMEQTGRSVDTSRTTMEHGMGMLFLDSYAYQFNVDRIDVNHKPETAFVFEYNGETHIAQSYTTHDWEWRWTPIPMPYAVPEYGGTQVVDADGNVRDMSPQEVQESEMFVAQNTYPYDLARFRMQSMQLRNGLLNKWFVGDGVPQIADTGGFSDNKQPFTVPMNGDNGSAPQLDYFIAATPASSGDGIYQIYRIDGQSGAIEYVEFDDTQAGPQKAAGYTRSQNRAPNWKANNEDGSTQVTEPIPLVIDGQLYWHMRVTPGDGARISYTTFVNADTGDVYRASDTEAIYKFIEDGGGVAPEPNESDTTPGSVVTVVVLNEDGSVAETYEVRENQTVEVRPND